MLAAIITHKYDEHQPLYRQELSLWRHGLFLSRSTTCTWMGAVAELLQPLIERMKHDLLQSRVIQTDSTPVDVLIEGLPQAQTGHFWPYLGDKDHPVVVIAFSLDHKKEHALAFLANYSGYVQADASSGYDILFVPDGTHRRIEVGCWAHTERKFEENRDSDPKIACQSLGFIKALFDIEKRARREHLSEDDVLVLRQSESVPILAEFNTWIDATSVQVLPKSPMGEALGYVRNQWTALNRYTEAGFLEMTNNAPERMNKIIAIGRGYAQFRAMRRCSQSAAFWLIVEGLQLRIIRLQPIKEVEETACLPSPARLPWRLVKSVKHPPLHLNVGLHVLMSCFGALVTQPQRDHRHIDSGLQQVHGRRVSDRVRRHRSARQRRALALGSHYRAMEAIFDARS